MKRLLHRGSAVMLGICLMPSGLATQELESIRLNPPDTARGFPFMRAAAVKASATEWSSRDLSLQDLSDLMWAANGLNRPDENKTTASSAMNAHDVDIYVFMRDGVYVYDYRDHELDAVRPGDFRSEVMMQRPPRPAAAEGPAPPPPSDPPIQIVLISDADRFRAGTEELKYEWGAIDTGIISQNISLFCAATGLKTRPRASVDKERIGDILGLRESQHVFLNHAVGYAK